MDQTSYSRFIILTAPRSGTNMLRSGLLQHKQIVVYPEIFNEIIGAYHPYNLQEPASSILSNYVFHPFHAEIKAVGFPLSIEQANQNRGANWQPAWQLLQSDNSLKIIQVRRRNPLKRYISWLRASSTQQWTVYENNQRRENLPKLNVPPAAARQWLERSFKKRQLVDRAFENHPQIDIWYEDLCADTAGQLKKALTFLDLPEQKDLAPTTTKQGEDDLRKMIGNYDELKADLENTPWHPYFDD